MSLFQRVLIREVPLYCFLLKTRQPNLHVCLLENTDPELIPIAGVGAEELAVVPDGQAVVNDDLPSAAIQVEAHQVLSVGVDDGITASVLRVETPIKWRRDVKVIKCFS